MKERNVAKAQNSSSIQSALFLTHRDFSYTRSGQYLKLAKPYSICPVVNPIYYQMHSLLLKVTLIISNSIFSGSKYTLQSATNSNFYNKTGLAAEVKGNMLQNHTVRYPFTHCSSCRLYVKEIPQVRLWDLEFQAWT